MLRHPVADPQGNTIVEPVKSGCLTSFQRQLLTQKLQTDLRPEYRQRIEIMLLADQGYSQAQICSRLGCCHQTVRYWVVIAQTGKAHQWDEQQIGRPKVINELYRQRLRELVGDSPRKYGYPFQRWTAQWLGKQLMRETRIEVSDRHINRLLKEMGLSTRPHPPVANSQPQPQPSITSAPDGSSIVIRDLHTAASSNYAGSI
jgi:transposase